MCVRLLKAGEEEAANPFSPEDEEEGGTGSPGSEQPTGSPAISPLRDEEDGTPAMADQPAPDATSSPPSASPTDVPLSWGTKASPASSAGASSPPPRPKTASPVKAPPARPQEDLKSPAIASPALTSPAMVSSPAVQSDGISSPDGRSVGSSVSGGSPAKGAKKRHSISVVRGLTAFVKGKKKDKDKTEENEATSLEPLTPPEGAGADKEDGQQPPKAKRSMSALFGGRRNSAPAKVSPHLRHMHHSHRLHPMVTKSHLCRAIAINGPVDSPRPVGGTARMPTPSAMTRPRRSKLRPPPLPLRWMRS